MEEPKESLYEIIESMFFGVANTAVRTNLILEDAINIAEEMNKACDSYTGYTIRPMKT